MATEHFQLPIPSREAEPPESVDEAFDLLIAAIAEIDAILKAHANGIADKAAAGHGHEMSAITGLVDALAAKMPASRRFRLAELGDVIGADDAPLGYILAKAEDGWSVMTALAALGGHFHGIGDVNGLGEALATFALKTELPKIADIQAGLYGLTGGILPIVNSTADTTTDWQTVADTAGWFPSVLRGSAPNGPGGNQYYFALTMRRASGSSKAVLAIPRHGDGPIQLMTWDGAAWSAWRQLAWSDEVVSKTGDTLSGGYTATATDDGTKASGTYRPTPVGGNLCRAVNGGAFTLAAPNAAGDYTLIVQISNMAGAGAITLSGFTKVTGDNFTTTSTHRFMVFITKVNALTHAHVTALQ